MSVIRIRLYASPAEELRRLWDGAEPPRWVRRTLETRGTTAERPTASALVEVLQQRVERRLASLTLVLRHAEARGWSTELRGDAVVIASGLAADATRRALEADGTWYLVDRLVAAGEAEQD